MHPNQTVSVLRVIRDIVRMVDPEKILLISASIEYLLMGNPAVDDPPWKVSRFEFLVLVESQETKSLNKLDMALGGLMKHHGNFQYQVQDILRFNQSVAAGNECNRNILLRSMIYYDNEQIPFAIPF